jgi:hypothetical protein
MMGTWKRTNLQFGIRRAREEPEEGERSRGKD